MSNRSNRYRTMYERLVRPNVGSTFPKHVFVRAANLEASVYDRVGNRYLIYFQKVPLERTASIQL